MNSFSYFKIGLALSAVILLSFGCQPSLVTIDAPIAKSIAISPKEIDFDSNGGSEPLLINSTVNWKATCSDSWVSTSVLIGSPDDKQIVVTARENTGETSRNATITISSNECTGTIEIIIRQAAKAKPSHPLAAYFGTYTAANEKDYFGESHSPRIIISEYSGDNGKVNVGLDVLTSGVVKVTGIVNLSNNTIKIPGEVLLSSDNKESIYFYSVSPAGNDELTINAETTITMSNSFSALSLPSWGIYGQDKTNDANSGWGLLYLRTVSFTKTSN